MCNIILMMMQFRIIFLLVMLLPFAATGQVSDWMAQYDQFKEASIDNRFFKHADLESLLDPLQDHPSFGLSKLGYSLEGREIYLIKIGHGDRKLLLWSQMHGDEPTATMAIMDLINFFKNDSVAKEWKEGLYGALSIYIIPMLNPDGAEIYDRRNAAFIDLNRDALRLQSPESKILKRVVDSLHPEFGFNLHDQSRYYAAGNGSEQTASFSFLAPPFDDRRTVNTVRLKAMQLIGSLQAFVHTYLPDQVGRYYGSYEARAFGDNITKWGTSTVLIEVGGLKDDPEKQILRKVHFGLLLHAFDCVVNDCYLKYSQNDYNSIPLNHRNLEDLIIRNVLWPLKGDTLLVDMAFRRNEVLINDHREVSYWAELTDVGDLSTLEAYHDYDMDSAMIREVDILPGIYKLDELPAPKDIGDKIRAGYCIAYVEKEVIPLSLQQGPIRYVRVGTLNAWKISLGGNPCFYLIDKNSGDPKYLINNGQVFSMDGFE